MNVGYQCEYCSEFIPGIHATAISLMEEHEKKCEFNPRVKSCYTCKERFTEWGSDECKFNLIYSTSYAGCEHYVEE